MRNCIEFDDLGLVERQIAVLVNHLEEVRRDQGVSNETITSAVQAKSVDKMFDDLSQPDTCSLENNYSDKDFISRVEQRKDDKWANVMCKSTTLASQGIQLGYNAPKIK